MYKKKNIVLGLVCAWCFISPSFLYPDILEKTASAAKKKLLQAQAMLKTAALFPQNALNSFRKENLFEESQYLGAQYRFGSDSLAFVYTRWDDFDDPYSKTYDAMIEPYLFEIFWDVSMDLLPDSAQKKAVENVFNEMKTLKSSGMFALDLSILLKDVFEKRIKPEKIPFYLNRLLYKISQSSEVQKRGVQYAYDDMPSVFKKMTNTMLIPTDAEDIRLYESLAKSEVYKKLLSIVAEARGKMKYSQRTEELGKLLPLITQQLTVDEKQALLYWVEVHVGEWDAKVSDTDKKTVKPGLTAMLDSCAAAMKTARFSAEQLKRIDELKGMVERGEVEEDLAKKAYPEKPVVKEDRKKLKIKELIEYYWNRYQVLTNEDFLSLLPFANLNIRMARAYVEGALLQYDRDLSAAYKAFQVSPEGSELWKNVEKGRTDVETAREQLRSARKKLTSAKDRVAAGSTKVDESDIEELEGRVSQAQERVDEAVPELREASTTFTREASMYAFVDPERELELLFEGKEEKPLSPRDRLILRLALLKKIAPSVAGRALNLNALGFEAAGVPLFDRGEMKGILELIAEAKLDKNQAHLRDQFLAEGEPEKQEEEFSLENGDEDIFNLYDEVED